MKYYFRANYIFINASSVDCAEYVTKLKALGVTEDFCMFICATTKLFPVCLYEVHENDQIAQLNPENNREDTIYLLHDNLNDFYALLPKCL